MNERYKIINECDHSNIWYRDFPAQLEKTRVLFDSNTDKIVIQFKLRNISNKTIDTTYLKIICRDVSGQDIVVVDEHIMPMLASVPNSNFGEKDPLFADDKRIASISVFITKVAFSDGTTWDNSALDTGVEIEPAKTIQFTDALQEQFLRSTTHINEKIVMFEEHHDYWRCTCNRINLSNSDSCVGCNTPKADLLQCFSVDYLKTQLDEYNEQQEIARKDSIYSEALALSEQNYISDLEKAKVVFSSIIEWKDSADKVAYCEQRISELKEAQEKQRIESAKKAKKVKIITAIVAAVIAVGSGFAVLCVNVIIPNVKYNNAMSLLGSGKYDEAYSAFEELGDYNNAFEQLPEVRYQQAHDLLKNGCYDDAFNTFSELGEYSDSVMMKKECKYQKATYLFNKGQYGDAYMVFSHIDDYQDSSQKLNECKYNEAKQHITNGEYDKAISIFKWLGEYSDCTEQIKMCQYKKGLNFIDNEKYDDAIKLFTSLGDYSDSSDKLLLCKYNQALENIENQEYDDAILLLTELGDYSDSVEKVKLCKYHQALNAIESDDYETAYTYLIELSNYLDLQDVFNENCYEYALELLEANKTDEAYSHFELVENYLDSKQQMQHIVDLTTPVQSNPSNTNSNENGYTTTTPSVDDNAPDFRNVNWNMSLSTIKSKETANLSYEVDNALLYDGVTIYGKNASILYGVNDLDQLYMAAYLFTDKYETGSVYKYINDYQYIEQILSDKYGLPYSNADLWTEKYLIDNIEGYAETITVESFNYSSLWTLDDTCILLSLKPNEYDYPLQLVYQSLDHLDDLL